MFLLIALVVAAVGAGGFLAGLGTGAALWRRTPADRVPPASSSPAAGPYPGSGLRGNVQILPPGGDTPG
jgi:hypothetical protein